MLTSLLYAFALALAWIAIVGSFSLENLAVGMLVGIGIVLLGPKPKPLSLRRLPSQLLALIVYVLMLFRDICFSGMDVARRVLSPDMRLKPGIITVSTQDKARSPTVLALSANTISLTPGELVVEVADDHLMYVHCLNVDESAASLDVVQARRLSVLMRMLGRES